MAAHLLPYADLHEHLKKLEAAGLLIRVERAINKDTEMHPLVRWQFRGGIAEKDRKAFLFTNVTDSKGRKYDIPVVVGALAANREIYRLGMNCALDKINETWTRAIAKPIAPNVVTEAPCQQVTVEGLDELPIPISTPGWDIAPFTTLSQYITKDPDSGVQNMGIYRGQVKAPRRLGMNPSLELRPGIYTHWEKMKARGEKLPAAVVLGAPPCVAFTSAQKVPEALDELHVAGGLVGAPINVVKAKTVDLLVPAEAEIVVEGYIDTEYLEPEAPFGESHGHVNLQEYNAFMEVTCITRRKNAILTSIISQVTLKEDFPPISLPKREYMERARVIWEELGLPALKPEAPWYGYSLGDWPAELEQAAQAAVRGEYFATGEKLVTQRRQDVAMNTEVQRHGGEKAESDE